MLRTDLQEAMKAAMKSGDKPRLAAIRLILAAVKQREVDERIELDDTQVLAVLDKMIKQRRESITQFEAAGRQDLVDKEALEVSVIQDFLPKALTEDEIAQMIEAAVASTGAASIKDMGKVMGILRPQMQGRADMSKVSEQIKKRLAG